MLSKVKVIRKVSKRETNYAFDILFEKHSINNSSTLLCIGVCFESCLKSLGPSFFTSITLRQS